MSNFNRIAWIYDELANLIFGGKVLRSQTHYLHLTKPNSNLLIIGGGTGQILKAMNQLDIPLTIDFIEPSEQMIEKARRRSVGLTNLQIQFHQQEFKEFPSRLSYDRVCCFFFLDLFEEDELMNNLIHIRKLMADQSFLLVSDFQIEPGKAWQKVLSGLMHYFFKWTAGLESSYLKDINQHVLNHDFQLVKKTSFYSQFIMSAVYSKILSNTGNLS